MDSSGFKLFATGQYNARGVLDQLTAAGLRTRPTRSRAAKPLSLSQFYLILTDRYYLGFVEYQGEEYSGRHEPLVTPEVFDCVQRVLALRGGGGTRERRHHHWLKGLLWCVRCGRRIVISPGKGNDGTYFYFLCMGRQARTCDQPLLKTYDVEKAVERHYAGVRLITAFRARLRQQLDAALRDELASLDALKRNLSIRTAQLDAKEAHYLDLVGEPGWPREKIKEKLQAIASERAQIEGQVVDASSKLDTGRKFFLTRSGAAQRPTSLLPAGRYGCEAGTHQGHLHEALRR